MTKNTKALDKYMLDFRRYAERVIYLVEKKEPKASVNRVQLVHLWLARVGVHAASTVFLNQHRLKEVKVRYE